MRVDVFKSVKAYVARYESLKAQAAADPAFVWPAEIRPHSDEEQVRAYLLYHHTSSLIIMFWIWFDAAICGSCAA
jgi:hypothetical protein